METRKVQRLGPSTLAMTLPAEWASAHDVEKATKCHCGWAAKAR